MAPHTVTQALKTAVFCAAMMEELGIESSPTVEEKRSDIIQMVKLGSPERMERFCLGIQAGAVQAGNTVLLAAVCASGILPFGVDVFEDALKRFLPPKLQAVNLKALELGRKVFEENCR